MLPLAGRLFCDVTALPFEKLLMRPWLFFDVGNVLFDDTRQMFVAYDVLYQHLRLAGFRGSFSELLAEREVRARAGENWINRAIAEERLTAAQVQACFGQMRAQLEAEYDRNHLLWPEWPAALDQLSASFQLGIIANQAEVCRESLRRRGLLSRFQVVAISDELGMEKPHHGIFDWAQDRSGAAAADCWMIGDRIDNDVVPAQALGWRAGWLRMAQRQWQPQTPAEQEFAASLARVSAFNVSPAEPVYPDVQAHSIGELVAALLSVRAN